MNVPSYLTSSRLTSLENVCHGFFTRQGGVSSDIFTSLNCGLASGDNLQDVIENRERVRESLGLDALFTLKQVHSNRVMVVDRGSDPTEVVEADGLVSMQQGVGLGALGADCAPVLFADIDAGVVGSAHAGWQGALSGVTDSVIEKMCELGALREKIVCAIGPAIGWVSYEVGTTFMEAVLDTSPIEAASFFRAGKDAGLPHFNLPGYIRARIQHVGVEQIDLLNEDTYANPDQFFSYRRSCHLNEAGYGRQISVIGLT
ncbi:MAG: peptidoglycan editing factor PgeF [Gammaproteobacteria bacterium]|nr:peptidoglycan editing factor PgeF [Gammaproteobacteria bacterium]